MKFFKYSRFSRVRADEFYQVPGKVMTMENTVREFKDAGKILRQGLRTDLGDIIFLLLFPIRVVLSLLFSGVAHRYLAKKFFQRYNEEQRETITIPHATFYTLDWKRYFSNSPVAWDQY